MKHNHQCEINDGSKHKGKVERVAIIFKPRALGASTMEPGYPMYYKWLCVNHRTATLTNKTGDKK